MCTTAALRPGRHRGRAGTRRHARWQVSAGRRDPPTGQEHESDGPERTHQRSDAAGTGGTRRARRHQIRGGPAPVPTRSMPTRRRLGADEKLPEHRFTRTDGPAYRALDAAMHDVYGRPMALLGQGGSDPTVQGLRRHLPRRRDSSDGRRGATSADSRTQRERRPHRNRGNVPRRGPLPPGLRGTHSQVYAAHTADRDGGEWVGADSTWRSGLHSDAVVPINNTGSSTRGFPHPLSDNDPV